MRFRKFRKKNEDDEYSHWSKFDSEKEKLELFRRDDRKEVCSEEICVILENADERIFTLEIPLTNDENSIKRSNLRTSIECVCIYFKR